MKRQVIQVYCTKKEKELIQLAAVRARMRDSEFAKKILLSFLEDGGNVHEDCKEVNASDKDRV